MRAMFDGWDANKDGAVTKDEIEKFLLEQAMATVMPMMKAGMIEAKKAAMEELKKDFDEADVNKDG